MQWQVNELGDSGSVLAMGIRFSSDTSRKLVLVSTAKWRPQREFCPF